MSDLMSCETDKSKEENVSASGGDDSDDDAEKDVDDEEDVLDDESEEYLARLEKVWIALSRHTLDFVCTLNISDIL